MESITFECRKIVVPTLDGDSHSVLAWASGDWAIHPTLCNDCLAIDQWSVTYIPSGLRIDHGFQSVEHAQEFIARIHELGLPSLLQDGQDVSKKLPKTVRDQYNQAIRKLASEIENCDTTKS